MSEYVCSGKVKNNYPPKKLDTERTTGK
uniref:Uncharacterized protein n=1 Tax=Arundo donax TaxID=35708 RepID=A0A0A9HUC1_ARUDO